jgi:hypothetical protein
MKKRPMRSEQEYYAVLLQGYGFKTLENDREVTTCFFSTVYFLHNVNPPNRAEVLTELRALMKSLPGISPSARQYSIPCWLKIINIFHNRGIPESMGGATFYRPTKFELLQDTAAYYWYRLFSPGRIIDGTEI